MLEDTKKVSKNPLYKQIEQKFNEDEEFEKEKTLKQLQSLKNLHQPLDHEDLMEHAKKVDEMLKEKTEKKKEKRLQET